MKILKRDKKKKITSVKIKGDMVWFIAGIVLSQEKSLQKSVAKEEKGKPMPLFSITSDKSNICWRKIVEIC